VDFARLSEGDRSSLVIPFGLEEIEVVVRESDGTKSPGPDGLILRLSKSFGT